MADPLAQLAALSWPVSATLHLGPGSRSLKSQSRSLKSQSRSLESQSRSLESESQRERVLVLGDQHQSLRGACEPCDPPRCMTISQLLHALVAHAQSTGKQLDVFVEMQLVDDKSPAQRQRLLLNLEKRYDSRVNGLLARFVQKILEWMKMDTVFGKHPGFLLELIFEFRREFLRPDRGAATRFHYADARVNSLMKAVGADLRGIVFGAGTSPMVDDKISRHAVSVFYETYESVASVEQVVRALCFSRNLARDVKALKLAGPIGARAHARLGKHPLVKRGMYKVAKQYWKLAPRDRASIKRFYEQHLAKGAFTEADFQAARSRSVQVHAHEDGDGDRGRGLALALLLHTTLALMDVYLLARMVYYMRRPDRPPGSTTVLYAGDAHAENYRIYLDQYMHFEARECLRRKPGGRRGLFAVKRCVPMAACARNLNSQKKAKPRPSPVEATSI